MASSLLAAWTNLHARLAAHTWPAPAPQVTFGPPGAYEEQQVVAVAGIEEPDEAFAALGAGRSDERYALVVEIKVHDPAGDGSTVAQRVLALYQEVRSVVAADRTLGVDPTFTAGEPQVSLPLDRYGPAEGGGWVVFLTARIRCSVRIT